MCHIQNNIIYVNRNYHYIWMISVANKYNRDYSYTNIYSNILGNIFEHKHILNFVIYSDNICNDIID